ncbi:MAG: DUF1796 family putative cysteine peptidase [Planctomycetota bacterium]
MHSYVGRTFIRQLRRWFPGGEKLVSMAQPGTASPDNYDLLKEQRCPGLAAHIRQATTCQEVVQAFFRRVFSPKQVHNCVSLGQNCSTAWYLKQTGNKQASFPFDWVFSSSAIILDCIETRFSRYLDVSLISASQDGESAGHSVYHNRLYAHRNPLASDAVYGYYTRCCDRFLRLLDDQVPTVFVMTLINEPEKRTAWSSGFGAAFPMPTGQDAATTQPLRDRLLEINPNAAFLILDHATEQPRCMQAETLDDRTCLVQFHAEGESNGVHYTDAMDDFCCKLIYAGMC